MLALGLGTCESQVCVIRRCGDGQLDEDEICDDGNSLSGDGCRNDCKKIEICGDTLVDVGEGCDDGNGNAADGCDVCRQSQWSAQVLAATDLQATSVALKNPRGVFVTVNGDFIVADTQSHRVVRVDVETGLVALVAGTGVQGYSGDGGQATQAKLGGPHGVAVDGLGNIFIADTLNNRIRRVGLDGIITTVAGTGAFGGLGDSGPAFLAQLANPQDVFVDGGGNLLIADTYNMKVRRIDAQTGIMSTVAGTGTPGSSGDNGLALHARLSFPSGVFRGSNGDIFIADTENHRIRRIAAATGVITTVIGTGFPGYNGDNIPASGAFLQYPRDVFGDAAGNLFIADTSNSRIRRVDVDTEYVTTVAGTGISGFNGDGALATSAQVKLPQALVVDNASNLIFADTDNHRIRRIAGNGAIASVVGTGSPGSIGDERFATSATLNQPFGIAHDDSGNLFIADTSHHRVRRVDAQTGVITTVAGSGNPGYGGDGGPAAAAQLNNPHDVAVDDLGNVFIADSYNHRIRRVDSQTGIITTFAGTGVPGFSSDGIAATSAHIGAAQGLFVDGARNVFIADTSNQRIRRVDAQTGVISTVAGTGDYGGNGDNGPATSAELAAPRDVFVDALGNLLIADTYNHRIRRVDSESGILTTVVGTGTAGGTGDGGPATAATLHAPHAVFVDAGGGLIIADYLNSRVRRVAGGTIQTIAGTGTSGGEGELSAATSVELGSATSISVDAGGHVFVATQGGRVRRIDAQTGTISTVAGAVFGDGAGLLPSAHLPDPQAICVAESAVWYAGGRSGVVMSLGDQALRSIVGRYSQPTASGDRARYRSATFGDIHGVAYDPLLGKMYITETSAHRLHEVTITIPGDPDAWTIAPLANESGDAGFADGTALTAQFRNPRGLFFHSTSRMLYVADTGNHVIRRIDVDAGIVETVAGTPGVLGFFGDGDAAAAALLYQPSAMTVCPNGDMFIADTGSHRVRRIDAQSGTIHTVVGNGVASSFGEGTPAEAFSIDSPRGLACDSYGNLFLTSRSVVRLLLADEDGVIDGSGRLQTIYGSPTATTYPQSVSRCLTGIALQSDSVMQITDGCSGMLIELMREVQ
jgi:cysteine-rich repeat protein